MLKTFTDTAKDFFSKPAQITLPQESIDKTVRKLQSEGNLKGAAEFKKATSRDMSFRTVTTRVLAFGATAPVSIPLLFGKNGISNLIEVWGSAAEETVNVDGEAPTAEPETPRADAGKQNYDHTQKQAPTAEPETPRADAGKQNYDHTQKQAPPGLG